MGKMDGNTNVEMQPTTGLLYLVGGFAMFNSLLIIAENFVSDKIKFNEYMPRKLSHVDSYNNNGPCTTNVGNQRIYYKSAHRPSTPITDLFLMDYRYRIDQTETDWYSRNNSSLTWNEWARTNLQEARNICIEAEYFFGNSNILPKDWSSIVEKWGNISDDVKGDVRLDDGTFQPAIFDEPETGPIKSSGLGFTDVLLS